MSLSDRQWEFLKALAKLIRYADKQGYKLTGGDLQSRPGNKPRHSAKSFHYKRLAIDLNLFIDGKYQKSSEAHLPLGVYWEKIGGTWGGRFNKRDGNHYSWGEGRR